MVDSVLLTKNPFMYVSLSMNKTSLVIFPPLLIHVIPLIESKVPVYVGYAVSLFTTEIVLFSLATS